MVRAYWKAGIMDEGLVRVPLEGTPQGGPLSPFLSNGVLDELDPELKSRGHRFVRYGDDCNSYVKTPRAGERVMSRVRRFIRKRLTLTVNEAQSAVDIPQQTFLGFTFTGGRSPNRRTIAPESLTRFRAHVRRLTRRNGGIRLEERVRRLATYVRGWWEYLGYCETSSVLRDLDSWIRRLRCVPWTQ